MMKSRDFYNVVMSTMSDNSAVVTFCKSQIEKLDDKAKESAYKRAKNSEKREIVMAQLVDIFPDKACTVSELFDLCVENGLEVKSPQALTYMLTKLRENGLVEREIIKKKSYYTLV